MAESGSGTAVRSLIRVDIHAQCVYIVNIKMMAWRINPTIPPGRRLMDQNKKLWYQYRFVMPFFMVLASLVTTGVVSILQGASANGIDYLGGALITLVFWGAIESVIVKKWINNHPRLAFGVAGSLGSLLFSMVLNKIAGQALLGLEDMVYVIITGLAFYCASNSPHRS